MGLGSAACTIHPSKGGMKPSPYLAFAPLHDLLELEMGQLKEAGALLCPG